MVVNTCLLIDAGFAIQVPVFQEGVSCGTSCFQTGFSQFTAVMFFSFSTLYSYLMSFTKEGELYS